MPTEADLLPPPALYNTITTQLGDWHQFACICSAAAVCLIPVWIMHSACAVSNAGFRHNMTTCSACGVLLHD